MQLSGRQAGTACDNLTGDCPTLPISKSPVAVNLCSPQQCQSMQHDNLLLTCIQPLPEATPKPPISKPPILNTSLPHCNIVM